MAESISSERNQILRTSSLDSQPGESSVRQVSSISRGLPGTSGIRASTAASLWLSIQCKSSSNSTVGRVEVTRPIKARAASMMTRRRNSGSSAFQRGSTIGWSSTERRAVGQRPASEDASCEERASSGERLADRKTAWSNFFKSE
ncbi:hypothetical protein ES707_00001 [subsurface metagenome]